MSGYNYSVPKAIGMFILILAIGLVMPEYNGTPIDILIVCGVAFSLGLLGGF